MYNNLFQPGENEDFVHNMKRDLHIKSGLIQIWKEDLEFQ
jgi:hypothetical protein